MTELDLTILAIIGRDGPLSAYDIRKVFEQSVTPTWSSSTGSVYPSIARLDAAGMIDVDHPEGGRSRKNLGITKAGTTALKVWLTKMTPVDAAATPDLIRTRMFFLQCVDRSQWLQVVSSAIASTQTALEDADGRLRARTHAEGIDLRQLASEGVRFELAARLEWLKWLRAKLVEHGMQD